MDDAENPRGLSAGDNKAKPQPLRNSCEPCHVSKLRCSREKPICARCAKNGMNCTYAPTKRPGRPRKVLPGASSATTITQAAVLQACSGASHDTPRRERTESFDTMLSSLVDTRQDRGPLPGPRTLNFVMPSTNSQNLNNTETVEVFDLMDAHILDDANFFGDVLANSLESTTTIETTRDENEDFWMLLNPPNNTLITAPDSSQSPYADPAFWSTDPARFADDCVSLKNWIAVSNVLGSFTDVPEQGFPVENDCSCHTAVACLLFHRMSAKRFQPDSTLEACLHLQRVLFWVWAALKDCNSCWDDELIQFIVVGTVKEVVVIHRAILDEMASRLRNSTNRGNTSTIRAHSREQRGSGRTRASYLPQGRHGQECLPYGKTPQVTTPSQAQTQKATLFESTVLSLGPKAIQGPVKTSFLRRLISMKLRQISSLLRELLSWTQADTSRGSEASPLQTHITGILERINVTNGMLSILE